MMPSPVIAAQSDGGTVLKERHAVFDAAGVSWAKGGPQEAQGHSGFVAAT